MISVHFQGKPFNIIVIQVYDPTSRPEKNVIEQFYTDLTNAKKICPFHHMGTGMRK